MTKVPLPGFAKTRLRPFLDDRQCAELATAFLHDAEAKAKQQTDNTFIAFTPANQKGKLKSILHREHILFEQRGADLGERMHNAFLDAFGAGVKSAVMIGTDSPALPSESIESAFALLEGKSDAVIGRTADGGFYLIGLKAADKRIFENIHWSSVVTAAQTVAKIEKAGLKLGYVQNGKDIDRAEDLPALMRELERNSNSAPATAHWFSINRQLFNTKG